MYSMIKEIPFFNERLNKEDNSAEDTDAFLEDRHIHELASHVKYVRMKAADTVFEFESEGETFFVILSGLVSVQTPITEFEAETYKRAATMGSKVTFFQTDPEMLEQVSKKQDNKRLLRNDSKILVTSWEDENSFDSQDEEVEGIVLTDSI